VIVGDAKIQHQRHRACHICQIAAQLTHNAGSSVDQKKKNRRSKQAIKAREQSSIEMSSAQSELADPPKDGISAIKVRLDV